MPRRYFNWKLAIVLIISIVVLGVTAVGLRQWQRTNRADQGLILGNKAYDDQKWEEAAKYLGHYIAVEQNDVPVLLKYAEAQLKIRPLRQSNFTHAESAYKNVLRMDKKNVKAALQLTELYLLANNPGEAELNASEYLENNDDPEIRRMLALALDEQNKFIEAAEQLKVIIREHEDQILAYEMLGKIIEQHPDDFPDPNDSPAHWFDKAVQNNPSSALAYIARAGFYQRNEDRSNALTQLEHAEELDLSDPNDKLRLAVEFFNMDILDKAEDHLTSVQKVIPKNLSLWEAWAKLAIKFNSEEKMQEIAETGLKELSYQSLDFMPIATELFIRSGQLESADECISEMKQKDVAPIMVTFMEGFLAAEEKDDPNAIKHWNESMGLGNKSPQIRLALSSALSRVGNTQSAFRHLLTLVSEHPDNVAGYLALARLLGQSGNWTESSGCAEKAKQLSPENPEASLLYLQAQMQLRAAGIEDEDVLTFQEIEKQLSELEEAANNLPEFKLLKVQLALHQQNITDAQVLVTQLKKDDPSQIKFTMAEVSLLVAQDKTDEAIMTLLKALEEFPQDIDPVIYLANLLDRQGDKEKCETIIKDALERIDQTVAKRKLGLLLRDFYVKWNQNDKVYSLLNSLVQKLPEDILLKRRLLFCEQVINDPERAMELVDDIESLEGEEGWQWRYEKAKFWFLSDDFEARYAQIVSLLQENLLANPNDAVSRMLLAKAYDRSGELQLAISTYREVQSYYPDDPQIVYPLVVALYKAKENEEAERLLERAYQQKPDNLQLQQLQLQSHLMREEFSSASDILQDFIRSDPNNQTNRFYLALLKTQQGEYEEAGELLDKLKAQNPDSLPYTYAQVRLCILQNKPNEALRLCDEIVNNLNDAPAYIYRARTKATLKQIDKAIEDFEHAVAIEPNNVEVWLNKSEFYRSIGEPNEAIADIQNALSLDSSDIRVQKQAIFLYLKSGDTDKVHQDKGMAILDKALNSNPDDTYLRLCKAEILLMEETLPATNEAEQILQQLTEDQPEISQAWELLGKISLRRGQVGKAMDTVLRGLTRSPNNKALLLLKARAEAARLPILAIPTLEALREVDPNNINAALLLAEVYTEVGEPEKAVNLLREVDPNNINPSLFLAQVYTKVGELEKAVNLLREVDPNNIDAVLLLAEIYTKVGEPEKAVNLLEPQLASCDGTPEESKVKNILVKALYQSGNNAYAQKVFESLPQPDYIKEITKIAIRLQASGRSDEAIPLYVKVLERQPDSPDSLVVINNLAWIMCEDSEDKDKLQAALELANEGLDIDPNYIDLIDTRGFIYYQMGEFDEAVKDFATCIRRYPIGAPEIIGSHFRLARTFDKLEQKDKAVEHLNQALEMYQALDPESQARAFLTSDMNEAQRLLTQLQEGN
ncbi:MAG: tetratricopeptide repeat protein [Planctomycetota bacterium]|jgi:tetratricopeptide (TPR) repeat protein